MSISSHPPMFLGFWSVETGALNVVLFHMNYMTAEVICWVQMPGAVNICAIYHSLANK